MPKMKTHKGVLKRVRVSSRGRVKYKQPNAAHLMSPKSGKRRRRLRRAGHLNKVFERRLREAVASHKA